MEKLETCLVGRSLFCMVFVEGSKLLFLVLTRLGPKRHMKIALRFVSRTIHVLGGFFHFYIRKKALEVIRGTKKVSIHILKFLIWFMGKFITAMASATFFSQGVFFELTRTQEHSGHKKHTLDIISRC